MTKYRALRLAVKLAMEEDTIIKDYIKRYVKKGKAKMADTRIQDLADKMSRLQTELKERGNTFSEEELDKMLVLTDELNVAITQLEEVQKKIYGEIE